MTNGNNSVNSFSIPDGAKFERGLTKREVFAAMALQGILANPTVVKAVCDNNDEKERCKIFAKDAIESADALIEQLNKEK